MISITQTHRRTRWQGGRLSLRTWECPPHGSPQTRDLVSCSTRRRSHRPPAPGTARETRNSRQTESWQEQHWQWVKWHGDNKITNSSLVESYCRVSSTHTWISTRYTGSMSRGWAVSWQAYRTLRAVGIICPPPRWMASACSVTSWMSKRIARMFSSHRAPCRTETHTACQKNLSNDNTDLPIQLL